MAGNQFSQKVKISENMLLHKCYINEFIAIILQRSTSETEKQEFRYVGLKAHIDYWILIGVTHFCGFKIWVGSQGIFKATRKQFEANFMLDLQCYLRWQNGCKYILDWKWSKNFQKSMYYNFYLNILSKILFTPRYFFDVGNILYSA